MPAKIDKNRNPHEYGHASGGIATSSKFPL